MKISDDYHVYSKQGSYAAPHVINISDLHFCLLMFTKEKRKKRVRDMFLLVVHFFVFTSNEYLEQTNAAILVDTENLDE